MTACESRARRRITHTDVTDESTSFYDSLTGYWFYAARCAALRGPTEVGWLFQVVCVCVVLDTAHKHIDMSVVKNLQEATGKTGLWDVVKRAGLSIALDGNWGETALQLSGMLCWQLVQASLWLDLL